VQVTIRLQHVGGSSRAGRPGFPAVRQPPQAEAYSFRERRFRVASFHVHQHRALKEDCSSVSAVPPMTNNWTGLRRILLSISTGVFDEPLQYSFRLRPSAQLAGSHNCAQTSRPASSATARQPECSAQNDVPRRSGKCPNRPTSAEVAANFSDSAHFPAWQKPACVDVDLQEIAL
jgi:hypothetical protein